MLSLAVLCATAILFRSVSCECQQSYATICDNFEDLKNYDDKENTQELIMGSDQANFSSVNLMKTLQLQQFPKLTRLLVLRRINKLELTYGYQCTYYNAHLQHVTFYGNELKTIEPYHFPVLPLKKLSLVNNQIEEIKGWAFKNHQIEEFDASDNLIDVVQKESLPMTNATKTITMRRNKLSHVEAGSFHSKLQVLNLDSNNFRYILDEVLGELSELRELTLSRNKFNTMPAISHMKKLTVFDLSFNYITTVDEDAFKDMPDLQHVDLSNNKIHSESVLSAIVVPRRNHFTISLAFNRLRDLNLTGVSLNRTGLVLHGNPWDCSKWEGLKKTIKGAESKCDLEFQSGGKAPFCINYRDGSYVFTSLWENDIDRFHQLVRQSAKNVSCKSTPTRSHISSRLEFGCVA